MNALHPLSHGNILIVGVKSSNLSEEIKTNPRVIIWDSQQQHWTNKQMPENVQAVFMTRFVSHNTSTALLKQARMRRITIFNPEGTGLIMKQVKELLNMNHDEPLPTPEVTVSTPKEEETIMTPKKKYQVNKLTPLRELIDFNKGNAENGRILFAEANRCGIDTTLASVTQLVSSMRRKAGRKYYNSPKTKKVEVKTQNVDVSVDILDGIIKELQDMRAFLIATTEENQRLKSKVDKFKRFFDE